MDLKMSGMTSISFEYHHIYHHFHHDNVHRTRTLLLSKNRSTAPWSRRHYISKRDVADQSTTVAELAHANINQDKEDIVTLSHFPAAPLVKRHGTVTAEVDWQFFSLLAKGSEDSLMIEALRYLSKSHSTHCIYYMYISRIKLVCLFWSPSAAGMSQGPTGATMGCRWGPWVMRIGYKLSVWP